MDTLTPHIITSDVLQCPPTEEFSTQLFVRVYNPLSWTRDSHLVELPVVGDSFRVSDPVSFLLHKLSSSKSLSKTR